MQIFEIFEIFSKDNNVESNLRVELELGYNVAIKIFFKDIGIWLNRIKLQCRFFVEYF